MSNNKRVIVTGATGLIGRAVCKRLHERGYLAVVFSRNPEKARNTAPGAAEYVAWNPEQAGAWVSAIDGAHAIVHLAGESIAGWRWTESYKRKLRDSRIIGARSLVNAMRQATVKPEVFISGSAVGYYGPRDDARLDESAPPGDDFLAQLCIEWEGEASKAEELGARVAFIRTGVVLDKTAGALPKQSLPFTFFVGGPILPGTQWISWIHLTDVVGIFMRALEDERAHGPINATAPEPVRNRDFSATLGRVIGRPSWLPVPGFALQALLGELADTLRTGQRAIPQKAQDLGYQFVFPTLEPALRDTLASKD